jgi:uncharacterized protein (DUF488 family)
MGQLLELLTEARIEAVRDVRRFPASRSHPHFEKTRLERSLGEAGIGYAHRAALGGRRTPLPASQSPNGLWREPGFRGFADYALSGPFAEAIEQIVHEAEGARIALLCSEAVWWRCHRRLIADYLLLAGLEVMHILGPGRSEPARMTAGADPQPGGAIHYPAPSAPS